MPEELLKRAKEEYAKYMEEGLKLYPPFKGYGMKTIEFAIDEPNLYRELFLSSRGATIDDYFEEYVQWRKIIPYIQKSMDLSEADAKWLFKNMFMYLNGIASIFAATDCIMSEEEISRSFGRVFRGLMMQLKAPADERVNTMPGNEENLGDIKDYLKGKRGTIVGYGPEKEVFQIRLEAILYFEAVGEKVFAYTRQSVYEIKLRLYQVEDQISSYPFIRASKSLLINTKKVASISPGDGGRGKIRMINDEIVIASRAYYKNVLEEIKNPT